MSQFLFQEDNECKRTSSEVLNNITSENAWHVLIVDDEPAVHDVTRLIFKNKCILGKELILHSAYSAQEAKDILQSDIEFSMGFIDVVMESDHAGLDLINWIREDLENTSIRLILRTGQAGSAPEEHVISQYDIHDYKTKTELTQRKLTTCAYSAIRSYRDITTISNSLDAFKKLIVSSTSILKVNKISEFASAALTNLLSLMGLDSSSVYIIRQETDLFNNIEETYLACSGRFGEAPGQVSNMTQNIKNKIESAFHNKNGEFTDQYFISYYKTSSDASSVLYIEFDIPPTGFQTDLAEIFSTNVALVLESLVRQQQSENNQREFMYILGDAIEARSKETGTHVKRTALLCALISEKLQMPSAFTEAIKTAAPLHDVGKITIPESILHKPGKLDADEWEIMKRHAESGASILSKSSLPIAKLGCTLAHYHHENWDGSGYPEGLKGENIPIEARIMAIVDVIDALGSKRSYKEPWINEKILMLIKAERGIKFQPSLVDLVEEHFDEIMEIRKEFPD
jgi:response regulator RpfG family c-di-GMP phosphodiesterase